MRIDRRVRVVELTVSIVALTMLSACGGSGSGGDSDAAQPRQETSVSADSGDEGQPFEVTEQAWTSMDGGLGDGTHYVHWVAVVHNPNEDMYGSFPKLSITVKDKAGKLLSADEQVLDSLPPGADVAFASQSDVNGVPATVEIAFKDIDWYPTDTSPADYPPFEVTDVNVTHDKYSGFKVLGQVANPYDQDVSDLAATALFYDKSDKLVGGATGFPSGLPAQGSAPIEVDELGGDIPQDEVDHVEVVVTPWATDSALWNHLATGETS